MRYMVHGVVSTESGNRIEESGGPGELVGYLMDRFTVEAAYYAPTRREFWWVIDFPDQTSMLELMLILSTRLNVYPEFTPCLTGEEFPGVVGAAIAEYDKAPSVG